MAGSAVKAIPRPRRETFGANTRLGVTPLTAPTFIDAAATRVAQRPRLAMPSRRCLLMRGVQIVVLALAMSLGALVGSGILTTEGRFYRERLAALNGEAMPYGLPEVPGHHGANVLERRDLIRQFMALDAAN